MPATENFAELWDKPPVSGFSTVANNSTRPYVGIGEGSIQSFKELYVVMRETVRANRQMFQTRAAARLQTQTHK